MNDGDDDGFWAWLLGHNKQHSRGEGVCNNVDEDKDIKVGTWIDGPFLVLANGVSRCQRRGDTLEGTSCVSAYCSDTNIRIGAGRSQWKFRVQGFEKGRQQASRAFGLQDGIDAGLDGWSTGTLTGTERSVRPHCHDVQVPRRWAGLWSWYPRVSSKRNWTAL